MSALPSSGLCESSPRRLHLTSLVVSAHDGKPLPAAPAPASAKEFIFARKQPFDTILQIAVPPHDSEHGPPFAAKCETGALEYRQDVETGQLLLKCVLPATQPLAALDFTLEADPQNDPISTLTLIRATSQRELDKLITNDFFHNTNFQNESNVSVIGDLAERDPALRFSTSVPGGDKYTFCFAEYSKREHALKRLLAISLFIEVADLPLPLLRTLSPSPPPFLSATPPSMKYLESPTSGASPASNGTHELQAPYSPGAHVQSSLTEDKSKVENIARALKEEKKMHQEKTLQIVPLAVRPDNDSASQPEDGPLFRATITALEKKTGVLKAAIKKVLKRGIELQEQHFSLSEAHNLFAISLKEVAAADLPAFKNIMVHYNQRRRRDTQFDLEAVFHREMAEKIGKNLIEPLRRLYDQEIKAFDSRKREFDDESREYYQWLSRYLSMKQEAKDRKKTESDTKYVEKRRAFELCRFDYYSYMQDLHGGRKLQLVVSDMAAYTEQNMFLYMKMADRVKNDILPTLEPVVRDFKDANLDWNRQRTEREDRRRALERSMFNENENSGSGPRVVTPQAASTGASSTSPVTASNNGNLSLKNGKHMPQAINTDVGAAAAGESPQVVLQVSGSGANATTSPDAVGAATEDEEITRKEGLLWAMGKPSSLSDPIANLNKPGWHKFWVVLDQGRLCEYSNWKQGLGLHNDPINLQMACVREARSQDRRFCFEVVTPTYKRVYQATSEADMLSWIKFIGVAIGHSIEGRKMPDPPVPAEDIDSIYARLDDKSTGASNTVAKRDESLLKAVRQDQSNQKCADCGSLTEVEWVSINLLVVVCIQCSGFHRSLGSHISKIRSLTLDKFSPDLTALIKMVTNDKANEIWEANLSASRKNEASDNRSAFITEKYVEKKFLNEIEKPNALLREAVGAQDLLRSFKALASRANPNTLSDDDDTIFIYSLKSASADAKTFPISELLLLSSANLPKDIATCLPLSAAAKQYVQKKLSSNASTPPATRVPSKSIPSTPIAKSVSGAFAQSPTHVNTSASSPFSSRRV